jgi:hypothetical protein
MQLRIARDAPGHTGHRTRLVLNHNATTGRAPVGCPWAGRPSATRCTFPCLHGDHPPYAPKRRGVGWGDVPYTVYSNLRLTASVASYFARHRTPAGLIVADRTTIVAEQPTIGVPSLPAPCLDLLPMHRPCMPSLCACPLPLGLVAGRRRLPCHRRLHLRPRCSHARAHVVLVVGRRVQMPLVRQVVDRGLQLSAVDRHAALSHLGGRWAEGGWKVGGRWVEGGWKVGGRWAEGGWKVGGRWVEGGRKVGGQRSMACGQ